MTDRDRAIALADQLRVIAPEHAATIDRAVAELDAGKRDGLKIDVNVAFRLEKFDGDYEPGMKPVEVIEHTESI